MITSDPENQTVSVIRVFEMKPSRGLAHAPGMVAVLDAFPCSNPQQYVGRSAMVSTPAEQRFSAKIEGVRDHGATISFYFRGLGVGDLPIGSLVTFEG